VPLLIDEELLRYRAKLLRKNMTPAERRLWQHIRSNKLGVKVRRQHIIAPYIVDFYIPSVKLVIELDGSSHNNKQEYDEQRTARLVEFGYRVIRFDNTLVRDKIDDVLEEIRSYISI